MIQEQKNKKGVNMLYPISTRTRKIISLDGIWRFKLAENKELNESQVGKKLQDYLNMPVPSSYNDITADKEIRNHQGWVWYERDFVVQPDLLKERLLIRFGSATHKARLYVNGKFLTEHIGGFTPFEIELNDYVKPGTNLIQLAVDNKLDLTTLPVGMPVENGDKVRTQCLFDFFNYAGIHRPVKLYTTPVNYIQDITIDTTFSDEVGFVKYAVATTTEKVKIELYDENDGLVASSIGKSGTLEIPKVTLWEPLKPYLYDFKVLITDGDELVDEYVLPIGVRTVEVVGKEFLINNKPFYFKGFGKHEDSHVHGRGFDEALNVKDIGLLKWIGANSYRTSHYPYSEEMMRLSMREGIVIIDEVPAVGQMLGFAAFGFTGTEGKKWHTWRDIDTTKNHELVIRELIARDKNNPAVVMWSIANEPDTHLEGSVEYFQPLYDLTKELDVQKRPVTIVTHLMAPAGKDLIYPVVDVLSFNRYYGWYVDGGDLVAAEQKLRAELSAWEKIEGNKPILFTEYGADTVPGLHDFYDVMFTEEYQVNYYEMNHRVFDDYPQVVGEQAWNFADFEVYQTFMRVQGNKKGMFTRERRPKMIAHETRKRWTNIPEFGYKK